MDTRREHREREPSAGDSGGDHNPKRRRRPGLITVNACTECRKRRAKCNGQHPCARCVTQRVQCVYEVPVRQSKDDMRAEIEMLHTKRNQAERILYSLTGENAEEILLRIRSHESIESICEYLNGMDEGHFKTTYPSREDQEEIRGALHLAESVIHQQGGSYPLASNEGGQWSTRQPTQDTEETNVDVGSLLQSTAQFEPRPLVSDRGRHRSPIRDDSVNAVNAARSEGQTAILGHPPASQLASADDRLPSPSWSNVTTHVWLVEHLMSLYFCWEFPIFAPLSKDHCVADYRSRVPRYCSPLLVNAMLALGCRFSSLPETRTNPLDPRTAGDHFFAEAKRLLGEQTNPRKYTTIQALGLMCLREASCGRDAESLYLCTSAIQLAVEVGLHCDDPMADDRERDVRRATFWGAFTLDQAWSMNVAKSPHLSYDAILPPKPVIRPATESEAWIPYTDHGMPAHRTAEQPSNVHSVYRCFCELSELIHKSLYLLYSPKKTLNSQELIDLYTRFLKWYGELPDALRLGYNFTPSVLFSHIYYHSAILALFRPFIKLNIVNSTISPRLVCIQAADAITLLLRSYDQLYTLKHTPSMVPYITLSASIIHIVTGSAANARDVARIQQSVYDLRAMRLCHIFAARALRITRFIARERKLEGVFPKDGEQEDELLELQPDDANLFAPGKRADWVRQDEEETLFTMFPYQGVPLLKSPEELEQEGFAGRRMRSEEQRG